MLISSVSRIQYDMGGAGMVNYIYVSGGLGRDLEADGGRKARHSGSSGLILTWPLRAQAGVAKPRSAY
jgi:hypothetical protein